MKKNFLILGIFCMGAFASCDSDRRTAQNDGYQEADTTATDTTATVNNNSAIQESTKEFVNKAASGNMMEVELGRLAQEKATSKEVKDFGQMMVNEHGAANEQLKTIAQAQNMQLPAQMEQEHQETVNRFQKLTKAEFDKEYVNLMAEDHKKDIELYEDRADDVENQQLKQYIDQTLPTLRKHKERIDQIQKSMKK